MQFRPNKRTKRPLRRPKRTELPLEEVEPISGPVEPRALITITLTDRLGRDCVIAPFPGKRPGSLRVMVNGEHWPALATTTILMDWLRRKLPRTSPKRAIQE